MNEPINQIELFVISSSMHVEVNSQEESIYTQIINKKRESRAMQTPDNLREKPAKGKSHSAKREIPLMQRDNKEFFTVYYRFNSLRFDPLQERSALIAER